MNQFVLMGRLTRDPEKKSCETPVARYTLAVDKNFGKDTDFINLVAFGKDADFALKYLKRGTKVLVAGRIEPRSYEKDGTTYHVTDLIVTSQEFCESKKKD